MPAGYNQVGRIWRYYYDPDDDVGGAMPTGTLLHESLNVRIEPVRPTMALLEQGLETVKLYRTVLTYVASDVIENDELEVTAPVDSWYYNKRFRIISVEHASIKPSDPRSQVVVTMRRRDEAHQVTG